MHRSSLLRLAAIPLRTLNRSYATMPISLYPDLEEIRVTRDGNVGIITLNRPQARNAFTNLMKDSIVEACARLDNDDAIKVVLMTGEPNASNIFCAVRIHSRFSLFIPEIPELTPICSQGADLTGGDFSSDARYTNKAGTQPSHNSAKAANEHRDGGGQTALAIHKLRKPSIVAINGSSVGIGMTMVRHPFRRR